MTDIFNYTPRKSHVILLGGMTLGGGAPLRLQSMTTRATTDTEGCVEQCIRIIEAGGDIVRLTTQGTREAENLRNIKAELRRRGYATPLVADVHFNPNVADVAAAIVEKVRINPGNYIDPARVFKHVDYTDEEYSAELQRLEERFTQLLNICREHKTALRIGVNHGSLSDRIMSRYGDTPAGIVESCMEFLRVCKKQDFRNVAISIKASNTVIMVQSVRLLVEAMEREEMTFPLHLGVTEAGEGEDGRIKSAVGIGALLADGIGDTIRVSLSEEPECEIPVAYKLASYVAQTRSGHPHIPAKAAPDFHYSTPSRRHDCVPEVISFHRKGGEKADLIWEDLNVLTPDKLMFASQMPEGRKFLLLNYMSLNDEVRAALRHMPDMTVVAYSEHRNPTGELRALIHELWREGLDNRVVVCLRSQMDNKEDFQLSTAADLGGLLFDGLVDGLMLINEKLPNELVVDTAFSILQAARLRMTKTEYISCPGCGRTLYDLPGTIARIKAATAHLTGLKIGIMGCIVNGPGEMADADYGYVGAARGKVSLYRGKECIEKNIPEGEAVERLLQLIENDQNKQ
ncbi:MAG: (E)-4-hydroxy-3-methylbut-2-enyl-diphosphate synthase [Bacteroidales bacterium]|nr:(E)-4-hydroxy-3-methylbut-2-enyl-diphosphate synthase [Bacteroidales bacterium]